MTSGLRGTSSTLACLLQSVGCPFSLQHLSSSDGIQKGNVITGTVCYKFIHLCVLASTDVDQ